MQPFAEFKVVVGDTVALIKECSGKIDTVVKQSEENERKTKQQEIDAMWARKGFELVPLAKISDPKWLNKGTAFKAIEADMDAKVARIHDDIATIEAIGEDIELLKSLYLDTLNLNNTIQYARTLKENRERARAEAEARAQAVQAHSRFMPLRNSRPKKKVTDIPPMTFAEVAQPELYIRAFKVTTTRENILRLGEFMNENGIKFEKLPV